MTPIENKADHDFWQAHIAQWQASGLSQAGYCRQQSIHTHQLSYWKRKFLADGKSDAGKSTGFTRVQVATHVVTPVLPDLSLSFKDGTQLTGITQHNIALTIQLIEVLR